MTERLPDDVARSDNGNDRVFRDSPSSDLNCDGFPRALLLCLTPDPGEVFVIHLSPEAETLATQLAEARGISPEEAVRVALEETSREAVAAKDSRRSYDRDELIRRMEEISARCGARPLVDPRSPDELLGYDDYGLPG